MLYSEFLEQEYNQLLEILNEFELKKLDKNKKIAKKTSTLSKARLNIKSKRLSLVRGKENKKGKEKTREELMGLARKNARRVLSKKMMNKNYDALSDQERIEFNKKKNEKKELFQRMISDEFNKLKAKYSGKKAVNKKDNLDKTKSSE
jgi:hypothetical protein